MDALELARLAHEHSKIGRNDSWINIYNESNENLLEIFSHYDIDQKSVLSVLASSEQLFSCYVKGASKVDAFDMSYVTLYYYYLRKWLILYKDKLYIPCDVFGQYNHSIYDFVSTIIPKDSKEEEAKTFWMKYLVLNNHTLDRFLFSINRSIYKRPFDNNINCLKNKLRNNLKFYHLNIAEEIDIEDTYDVIVLSNILEYQDDDRKLQRTRNNLENLLNDDGIIICSSLINNNESSFHKKEVKVMTENKLRLLEEISYYDKRRNRKKDLVYTYKKIR